MRNIKANHYLGLFVGVIAVSTSAIFVKLVTAPAGVTAFYRLFFSVLIMLPLFLIKHKSEVRFIIRRDWMIMGTSGVLLAFHFIFWFESLNYTSVASSTVLVTMQPLFAFWGAYLFFKEASTKAAVISATIAIIGSVIISWGDFKISGIALWGDILAVIACAFITFYFLFGQEARKRISLMTYTFIVYGISALTLFMYSVLKGERLYGYPLNDWILFVMLAILPTLLGHSLINWSVKWIRTTTISVAILFEPIGATILAYLILEETITLTQITGGIIIIGGIMLYIIAESKKR
ncbi:MAG: DMT family transporter [Lysinibacillus sp.]